MNGNTDALRGMLDDRTLNGRSPVEAAGEMLWLAKIEHDRGVLSTQSVGERGSIIDDWLGAQLGSPGVEIGPAIAEARRFAQFLDDYIDLKDPTASLKVDAAVMAWRQQRHT